MGLRVIFRREEKDLNRWQVIKWWELRRLLFNLVVGITGILTTTICVLTALLSENAFGVAVGLPDPPIVAILGIIAYAVFANLCYTLGWLVELFAMTAWKTHSAIFGEISFNIGLLFSVGLTLLPIPLVVTSALIQWYLHSFHS